MIVDATHEDSRMHTSPRYAGCIHTTAYARASGYMCDYSCHIRVRVTMAIDAIHTMIECSFLRTIRDFMLINNFACSAQMSLSRIKNVDSSDLYA